MVAVTRSVSSPSAAVLLPLGQPLGSIVELDGGAHLRVRLGGEIYRLDEPSAVMWRTLHRPRPGTSRGIDRGLLQTLDLSALGVPDPTAQVELLLDLGLAVELALTAPEVRQAFADGYRLLPLQNVLGNTESELGDFALLAGGTHRTVVVDAALRDVLIYGPRESDLYGTCYVRSGAFAAAEDLAELAEPDAFVEHVLSHVHALLDVHAAYFDLAITPDGDERARAARLDPASLLTGPGDGRRDDDQRDDGDDDQGIYAVGFLAGARRMWLGLQSVNIRVAGQELELANDEAWLLWTAAHGVADGAGIDDREQAICDAARAAGAPSPIFDLDDQQQRGMVVRPDGASGLVEFAATHRLEPLLCGIGNTASDPATYRLGITEEQPLIELSEEEHAVWRDAHLSASLLDAAHAAGRAGSAADLREYLRVVQVLSLRRAAYIDRVRQ